MTRSELVQEERVQEAKNLDNFLQEEKVPKSENLNNFVQDIKKLDKRMSQQNLKPTKYYNSFKEILKDYFNNYLKEKFNLSDENYSINLPKPPESIIKGKLIYNKNDNSSTLDTFLENIGKLDKQFYKNDNNINEKYKCNFIKSAKDVFKEFCDFYLNKKFIQPQILKDLTKDVINKSELVREEKVPLKALDKFLRDIKKLDTQISHKNLKSTEYCNLLKQIIRVYYNNKFTEKFNETNTNNIYFSQIPESITKGKLRYKNIVQSSTLDTFLEDIEKLDKPYYSQYKESFIKDSKDILKKFYTAYLDEHFKEPAIRESNPKPKFKPKSKFKPVILISNKPANKPEYKPEPPIVYTPATFLEEIDDYPNIEKETLKIIDKLENIIYVNNGEFRDINNHSLAISTELYIYTFILKKNKIIRNDICDKTSIPESTIHDCLNRLAFSNKLEISYESREGRGRPKIIYEISKKSLEKYNSIKNAKGKL